MLLSELQICNASATVTLFLRATLLIDRIHASNSKVGQDQNLSAVEVISSFRKTPKGGGFTLGSIKIMILTIQNTLITS